MSAENPFEEFEEATEVWRAADCGNGVRGRDLRDFAITGYRY